MALTSGFFNSMAGDRKYDALQVASVFDGIIQDGIFHSIGGYFLVTPNPGLNVSVATGRAWFNHTWTYNDSPYNLAIDAAHETLPRIDTVVLEVNVSDATRANSLKVIKGTPATTPIAPALINGSLVNQYPLAHISIPALTTSITTSLITNVVGSAPCPFVTGPLSVISISDLVAGWEEDFTAWFDHVRDQLDSDAAGNLQNQIDNIPVYQRHLKVGASKVSNRQGSNLSLNWGDHTRIGDWTNYDLAEVDTTIQIGSQYVHGAGDGEFVVTFPIPYLYAPIVILTPNISDPYLQGFTTAQIKEVTATGFTAIMVNHATTAPYHAAAVTALRNCNWMAIGPIEQP